MNRRLQRRSRGNGLAKAVTFGVLSAAASIFPYIQQALALDANALPSGGVVTGGSANLDYSIPNELHVQQNSDRAIIDWGSFNIGANALTQFHQPSSSSMVINKVTGSQDPTQILGTLKANGKVIVLDKNGVIFGTGSVVDVGSIVASTGDIDNASFMNGDGVLQLHDIDTGGEIVNNGHITVAEAGLAAFVAPTITNNGVINARMGKVALASGTSATVDLYGDGLVEVAVDAPLETAMIKNSGTIAAEGGHVLMTASVAKDIIDSTINTSGIVTVASATMKGGKIVLEGANTEVSGTLDASGKTGGGKILVGGDYQGTGTTKHADHTNITSTAQIKANTTGTDGNGGKVIVWADDSTHMDGAIEAKGGSHSGNGGLVETSGKINLGVSGSVNASANNDTGKAGDWLLDPQNVRITNSGAAIPNTGGTTDPTGSANPYMILDSSISAALTAGNNVTVTTINAGQGQSGFIELNNATILKSGGGDATLTLKADGSIFTGGTNSLTSNTGKLNTILWADADNSGDAGTSQAISLSNTTINTNGGDFFAGGGLDTGGSITDALGNVIYTGVAGDGRPDGFAISLGSHGVNIAGTSITTGAGNVTILGKGGSGSTFSFGVRVSGGSITTSSGNILLVGEGTAATTNTSHGIGIDGASSIHSTTTGSIILSGKGGAGTGTTGISVASVNAISAHDGAITLIGKGGSGGTDHHGVTLNGNVVSDGQSLITIKGQAGAGGYGITALNGYTVGGASAAGDQVYIADSFNSGPTQIFQTAGSITVKPLTASTDINLGVTSGTGLILTDSILSRFFAGTKLIIGDSALGTGDIIVDSWDLSGKPYDVELYGNDITFQDTDATAGVDYALKLGTGNFMAHAMDKDTATIDKAQLSVNAAILKSISGTSLLDLRSDRDIVFNNGNVTATTGTLNIVLNADRDADEDGAIQITDSAITTNNGWFVAGGGSDALWGADGIKDTADDATSTGADNIAAWSNSSYVTGIKLDNGDISTGSGAIRLNGHGHNAGTNAGVILDSGSVVETSSGSITVEGTGGSVGMANYGVRFAGSGTKLSSQTGSIVVKGTGGGDSSSVTNAGIYFVNTASIESTGSATIDLTAIAGNSTQDLQTSTGALSVIGGDSATGNITYNVNTINITNSDKIKTSGTILIKPRTIDTSIGLGGGTGTLNLDDTELSKFDAGTLIIGDSAAGTGDIFIDSWDLFGKTHNVELYGNDITIQDAAGAAGYGLKLGAGDFMAYAMDKDTATVDKAQLSVNAAILKSLSGTSLLDLRSDRDIVFNNGNITTTTGLLNVILNADRDADQDGMISITNSAITTNGGYAVLGGGSGAAGGTNNILGDGDGTGADDVAAWGNSTQKSGIVLDNGDFSTGAGALFIKGHGQNIALSNYNGILVSNGSVLESTTGKITLYGTGGNGEDSNVGINVTDATTRIESEKGNILLTGFGGTTGSATSDFNAGVQIASGATIRSSGTGSDAATITLIGTGANGFGGNRGVTLDSAKVTSTKGNITVTGTGSGTSGFSRDGVRLSNAASVESLGSATITITGTQGGTSADLATGGAGNVIGGTDATGSITLNLDTLNLDTAALVGTSIQTSGTINVTPRTTSTDINLGFTSTGLNLDDLELAMFNAGKLVIGDSAAETGDMIIDSWDLSGKTHNVELYANDITFQDTDATVGVDYALKLGTGDFMAHAMDNAAVDLGDLSVNAAIQKAIAGTSLLDLRADQNIVFSAGNITTTNGILNTILNADRDADQDGAVSIASSVITTNGGFFVAGGGSGKLWGVDGVQGTADDATSTGADNVSAWGNNTYATGIVLQGSSSITTNAGAISLRGHGYNSSIVNAVDTSAQGVRFLASSATTTSGAITINGTAGGTGAAGNTIGVNIKDGSTVQSGSSAINITGVGGGGSNSTKFGVLLSSLGINSVITTTGSIAVTGTGTGTDTAIAINPGTGGLRSFGSGTITLNALNNSIVTSSGSQIGGNTATGDIRINTDGLAIAGQIKTTGTLYINTKTAGATIGLGGGAGTLDINDAELALLFPTTKLVIGDSTGIGLNDITVDSWDLSGKTHTVELYGNDITIQDTGGVAGYGLKLGTGNFMAHAMDNAAVDLGVLSVNASIQKAIAGTSLLDLRADQNIVFSSGGITTTNGILNTVLNADRDADQDGRISITSSAIATNGGYFVAGGGSGKVWGVDGIQGTADDATSTGADKIAAWGNSVGKEGILLTNGDIATLGGNIILNGHAYNDSAGTAEVGIKLLTGSLLETSSGIITLQGTGGNGVDQNHGVFLSGNGAGISSENGAINIYGTAGANGLAGNNNNYGISLNVGAVIRSTGVGSDAAKITLVGDTAADSAQNNYGLFMDNAKILSKKGTIDITGTGRGTGSNTGLRIKSTSIIGSDVASSADIILTGIATGTSASDITMNTGSNVIGGTTGYTGNITFNTDRVNILNSVIQTSNTITVKPRTASSTIGLGGATGILNLDDAELAMFDAGTLVIGDSVNGTGNVSIASLDLSGKTYNLQLFGGDIDTAGITLGSGDVTFYSKGTNGITVSADSLSNSTGDLSLISEGNIRVNENLENAGTGHINLFAGWDGTSAITTPALFNTDDIDMALTARNVTIGANGDIKSAGTGTAVLIAASGNFLNNSSAAANAITTSAGRYLVYGTHPDDTAKGNLAAKNLYNQSYASALPSSITGGSRFVYTYQPTLTLTADDLSVIDPASAVYTFNATNLRSDDLLADAISGAATYTLGPLVGGNTRNIQLGAGTLTSLMGYNLVLADGTMTITTLAPISPVTPPDAIIDSALNQTANINMSTAAESDVTAAVSGAKKAAHAIDCLVSEAGTGSCIIN